MQAVRRRTNCCRQDCRQDCRQEGRIAAGRRSLAWAGYTKDTAEVSIFPGPALPWPAATRDWPRSRVANGSKSSARALAVGHSGVAGCCCSAGCCCATPSTPLSTLLAPSISLNHPFSFCSTGLLAESMACLVVLRMTDTRHTLLTEINQVPTLILSVECLKMHVPCSVDGFCACALLS